MLLVLEGALVTGMYMFNFQTELFNIVLHKEASVIKIKLMVFLCFAVYGLYATLSVFYSIVMWNSSFAKYQNLISVELK